MLTHKLSEDQLEYQKLAREFATREIAGTAHKYDQSGEFPQVIFEKLFETGLVNAAVPEKYNGLGLGCLDGCVIAEELAAGCSGIAGGVEASTVAQQFVIDFGTDEQKEKFLTPLMNAPLLAGFTMSGGLKNGRIFYRKEGNRYILSGKHAALVNGGIGNWYLVAASEDRREADVNENEPPVAKVHNSSFSYFLVSADDDLDFGERVHGLGRKAQVICATRMDEIYLDQSALLGGEGQGESLYRRAMVRTYPIIAAGMVGVARSALAHALKYAKERTTFGVTISQHQAVSFMLADMAKDIEAARLLVWQAAQLADQNIMSATEAVCAKAFAQEMVMRVTTDAVQIFGGYGYSREYPVEKLMRDAKVYQLYEHSGDSLKVDLGRQLVTSV